MYLCKEPGLYIMSFTRDLIVFFTLLNNSVEEMLLSTHECTYLNVQTFRNHITMRSYNNDMRARGSGLYIE